MLHSPTGFNWGYGGSGPADLALSLLMDALGAPLLPPTFFQTASSADFDAYPAAATAWALHQAFKWALIAPLTDDTWTLPLADIRHWIAEHGTALPFPTSPG